jgi:hypothetical protein
MVLDNDAEPRDSICLPQQQQWILRVVEYIHQQGKSRRGYPAASFMVPA